MSGAACAPYESPLLWRVIGPALRPGGLDLTKRALAWCGFKPGDRVLDLGCGLGASAGYMRAECGLHALGLDLSADMLAQAKHFHEEVPLMRASAGNIPLAGGNLNGVLCECVLSLTKRPQTVLKECRRVLQPNGLFVASDLYLRNPRPCDHGFSLAGCLAGARGREEIESMVLEAGLALMLWEDHSDRLGELAARLVWEHGSAEAVWSLFAKKQSCGEMAEWAKQVRPGYFLLVAGRKVESGG